jgi:hypothetical protein
MLTSPFRDQCTEMGIYERRECGLPSDSNNSK